jgi:hypothetical protein
MGRVRDYSEIILRLRALPRRHWRVEQTGSVWGYPFFCVRRQIDRRAPTILLTAGIHGEEPASVAGALQWLESNAWARWPVNWFVLPCINPYGWERHQRRNAQGRDINRQFRNPGSCPEASLVRRLVKGRRFLFMMDFHEDVDASGYYLYELRAGPPYVGERVIRAVGKTLPINRDKIIDGNPATGLALIRREGNVRALRRRRRWPMAFHIFLNCTDHVLGSETPVRFPVEQRAATHVVALRTALRILVGTR